MCGATTVLVRKRHRLAGMRLVKRSLAISFGEGGQLAGSILENLFALLLLLLRRSCDDYDGAAHQPPTRTSIFEGAHENGLSHTYLLRVLQQILTI